MTNWTEAVAAWNAKYTDGYRSAPAPDLPCEKCRQDRCVTLTTIHGKTTADCSVCAHVWVVG